MLELALIALLLLINALLVAAEIGIVASRKLRLEQSVERGEPGARRALRMAEQPTRYISTIQLGITVIALSLGALGEASLADRFQEWLAHQFPPLERHAHIISLVTVVIGLTLVMLWLSEILPKRLAMSNPERIARWFGAPVGWMATIAGPLVWVLTKATDAVLAVLGIKGAGSEAVNEDEVRGLIEKGTEAGVFHAKEGEIVDRVFELADRKVKNLMVPRSEIVWIESTDGVERVRVIVATSPHSHFPVCRGGLDNLIGVVHVKDLVKFGLVSGVSGGETARLNVEELARTPLFVPENTLALKLFDRFRETRDHLAIVVDEFGGTEGIITLNDLVGAIVGEVARPEGIEAEIVRRDDGSYLVDARVAVSDLCRELEVDLPDLSELGENVDANTVAGLVLALLGHVPRTGETVEGFGLRFEVVDMDSRRIDKVMVSRPAAGAPETV
ncbi:MAG: HlyC/CorC family transporter [Planctomycetes bacterium]|nr:HlyC/CorC family transporter [Planctomycetota bacterium]